jgi:hypothetical protein
VSLKRMSPPLGLVDRGFEHNLIRDWRVRGMVLGQRCQGVDGFITGPDDGMKNPMGVDGHRLHDWLNDGSGDPRTYRPTIEPRATVVRSLQAPGVLHLHYASANSC